MEKIIIVQMQKQLNAELDKLAEVDSELNKMKEHYRLTNEYNQSEIDILYDKYQKILSNIINIKTNIFEAEKQTKEDNKK